MRLLQLLLLTFLISCHTKNKSQVNDEILKTEAEFMDMLNEKGFAEAFEFYAASDGQILRGGQAFIGKDQIKDFYVKREDPNAHLSWQPENIFVSKSGDMAYSTGSYTFTTLDSLLNKIESHGSFGTVWVLQSDGSWKYLAD